MTGIIIGGLVSLSVASAMVAGMLWLASRRPAPDLPEVLRQRVDADRQDPRLLALAEALLDPDALPGDVSVRCGCRMCGPQWGRADEIAAYRDYDIYRYDFRLPGERVL